MEPLRTLGIESRASGECNLDPMSVTNPPKCEYPVLVQARNLGVKSWRNGQTIQKPYRYVPCGQCYHCRRKVVRQRQLQAVLEQKYPHYRSHLDPERQHFFTLTYKDTPMTKPQAHTPGMIWNDFNRDESAFIEKGKELTWYLGPFAGPKKNIRKVDGEPHFFQEINPHDYEDDSEESWPFSKTEITSPFAYDERRDNAWYLEYADNDYAFEHIRYLNERLGWSQGQVEQWISGSYEPVSTLNHPDIQKFVKRLRDWHARTYINPWKLYEKKLSVGPRKNPVTSPKIAREDPLRILWAGEYGGVTDRPHYHLLLFGLHQRDVHKVYELWENYEHNLGHVDPPKFQAITSGASLMRDRAATYQAKDLAKSRHLFQKNPAVFDRHPPRVDGSRRPAIGDGAYDWWLESQIKRKLLDWSFHWKTDLELQARWPNIDLFLLYKFRSFYTQVRVPGKNKRANSFPSPPTWRQRARDAIYPAETDWEQITDIKEKEGTIQADFILFDTEVRKIHEQNISELRERANNAKEKDRERIEQKRSRLIAAGKLRSQI